MKNASKIYRLAAERVCNGSFACLAVTMIEAEVNKTPVASDQHSEYVRELEKLFKPNNIDGAWYSKPEYLAGTWNPTAEPDEFDSGTKLGKLGRSLMLLFMAEIAEDGL